MWLLHSFHFVAATIIIVLMLLSTRTFKIMVSRSQRQSERYQLFLLMCIKHKSFACTQYIHLQKSQGRGYICICKLFRCTKKSEIEGQSKMFTIYSIILQ